MLKKGISLFLVPILLIGIITANAFAEGSSYSISLSPDENSVQVGGSVSVDISVSPAGWTGIDMYLTYDSTKLELTTTSAELGSNYTLTENTAGQVNIIGFGEGDLTLEFDAIAAGTADIEITYAGIADSSSSTSGEDIPAALPESPTQITVTASGHTVSGQVKSYNPNNAVTVKLMQSGAEKYSSSIAATSGSGQTTGSFSISGVADGTYDLVVTKSCHLAYTVTGVVVNGADIDLTEADASKPYRLITLLAGDVSGDTLISESDVSIVRYSTNINRPVSDAASPEADVNGDGIVNESDATIIRYTEHINKSLSDCTFSY